MSRTTRRPARAGVTSTRALLAAVATGSVVLTACSEGSSSACAPSAIPDHDESTLVIEGDAWSGYAPFRDEELLDQSGYTALYVEQVCQDVRAADLTEGRADIIVTTLDQYLLQHPEGTVVGVIDQSIGADALALGTVSHPELDSIDDVPGLVAEWAAAGDKPVLAYTGNSPSEMLLNELANTNDELRLTDFELVSVDESAAAFEMLATDQAQLAIMWEPETSAARAAGYTIALSSADVPDSIVDVFVASDRLIERDPAAVQAVVSSYYSTMDDLLARPDALEEFYAEDGGIDLETAETLIAGIQLYGTSDANTFMTEAIFPLDKPQIQRSIDSIGSLLALIHPDIPLDQAKVDGSYIGALTPRAAPAATGQEVQEE
jgi:OOP family OmpA-OmpF porin